MTSPRNNCFTDVERDSILSKLLAKEYFQQQYTLSRQAMAEADNLIILLESKDSLNQIKIEALNKKAAEDNAFTKKTARKEKAIYGTVGLLLGALVVALIL